jgi:hypothetical protein
MRWLLETPQYTAPCSVSGRGRSSLLPRSCPGPLRAIVGPGIIFGFRERSSGNLTLALGAVSAHRGFARAKPAQKFFAPIELGFALEGMEKPGELPRAPEHLKRPRLKAGGDRPQRPSGNFLLLGAPGVEGIRSMFDQPAAPENPRLENVIGRSKTIPPPRTRPPGVVGRQTERDRS